MARGRILIADDEANIRRTLKMILTSEGYQTDEAENGEFALEKAGAANYDAALLDIWMPGLDGLETLRRLRKLDENLCVIMMSGHGTIQTAVEALQIGAGDFLEKPLTKERTLLAVANALKLKRLAAENEALRQQLAYRDEMVGASPIMQQLFEQIQMAAPTKSRVLILGENGTGKELVARAIHKNSKRARFPFVKVNCAAIPEELIESELFGHEKGSFTGAVARKDGKFVQADSGTLFLDEVADMSIKTQAKVLRVLQEQELERVGGTETIKVDVRVIAATNKNLEKAIATGEFREDLYFRLNVIPMYVPPLRERKDDLKPLILHFLKFFCDEHDIPQKTITEDALKVLRNYAWPGNVRELRNQIERLVIMVRHATIDMADLPEALYESKNIFSTAFSGSKTLKEVKEFVEKEYITTKLDAAGGNVSKTAEMLGIERTNLYKKLKYYNIEPKS